MNKVISLFCFLGVVCFTKAQNYVKNKDSKVVAIDADVQGLELEGDMGRRISTYPYLITKDKSVKSFNLWQPSTSKSKFLIESKYVKNVFVTEGIKNCLGCRLRFEEKDNVYEPADFYINYKKLSLFSSSKERVRVLEPQFNIPPGTFIGKKIYTVYRAIDNTQIYDPVFGSKGKFVGLVENYLNTSEYSFIQPKVFDKRLANIQSTQSYLWLEPSIESYHFYIWRNEYPTASDNPDNTGVLRYAATADLYIQWKFLNSGKQVERIVPTRVVASSRIADPTLLFEQMVKESLASLLSKDSLLGWIEEKNKLLVAKFGFEKTIITRKKAVKLETSKALIKETTPAVVTVHNEENESFGSGFIVSDSGYVVTNYHVIENTEKVKIQFYKDTNKYDVSVLRIDPDVDLALLKVKMAKLPFLNFGNSEETEVGETVYAIGTPAETKLSQSVSRGIISGKREWEGKSYLQTDVSISPGNSGGPLVNEQGEVVGIVALKLVGRNYEGLSFVIPSNIAMQKLGLEYK